MVVSTDIESITWGETAGSESLILSPRATLGFDRTGRPTGLYENGLYTARGLDGRCLEKKWLWDPGRPDARRHIRALDDREREALRARLKTLLQSAQNAALAGTPLRRYDRGREIPADPAQLTQKIEKLTAFLDREWEADPRRFAEVWNPIGILPPDQYLSLVIQVVEGCAWNQCTFCDFYAARPFRVRTREEIDRHTDAAVRYFGDGLEGRCAVFLGDANALQAPPALLIPLAESLAQRFPRLARPQADGVGGLYAFAETARTAAWAHGENFGPWPRRASAAPIWASKPGTTPCAGYCENPARRPTPCAPWKSSSPRASRWGSSSFWAPGAGPRGKATPAPPPTC
jgi:plasmid stability protein